MGRGALVLGLDCGGTRTRAALCDLDGRLVGTGESGPGNARDAGAGRARAALAAAAAGACEPARWGALAATCAGLAGVWTEAERELARAELLPPGLGGELLVLSDLEIAHAGAFAGGAGLLLVAGTGAACFGRDGAGRAARAGGWGPSIDDAGSAHDLARRALAAAARAHDGRGPATALLEQLPAALGAPDLRAALLALAGPAGERDRLAALAPLVTAAAAAGDAVARELVATSAEELALAAGAVARALGLESPEVAAIGGLGSDSLLRAELAARLSGPSAGGARLVAARLPPVLGACWLALGRVDPPRAPGALAALDRGAARLAAHGPAGH